MPDRPADTIPRRLQQQAETRPDAPAYFEKIDGVWKRTTYREYAALVRRAAKALVAVGYGKGDTVAILGKNKPEWALLAVAAMSIGAAPAGVYTTSSPEEIRYIVGHAASKVVLIEDAAQFAKVASVIAALPNVEHLVLMRGMAIPDHPLAIGWDAFIAKGDVIDDARFSAALDALEPDGLATLIYTSGTTGPPKAVMLSHHNLAWTASIAKRMVDASSGDRSISYLPLSHIAEQTFTIHGPITIGSSIYFAESIEKLPDNLKEVRPTIFFAVPRIWEKFSTGIQGRIKKLAGAKKLLAESAIKVGKAHFETIARGEKPGPILEAAKKVAERVVTSKLKAALGLGEARILISGAAPIAKDVLEFLASIDMLVAEVYGQSEDTGPTSFNAPGKIRLGTVGQRIPGVEVEIASDGEILVRGPNVFLGYLKEPEATAETLVDGWLKTGDLGAFDADGYLSITGRKKEILITAGGKNISPKNIEGALKNHDLIGEAVVIGDRRKYLTALVWLDPEGLARFVEKHPSVADGPPNRAPELLAEIQRAVDDVNATLARVETVKKFIVLPRPLSIDTGELTPTLKVKRRVIETRFADEIEGMYRE